MKEANNGVEILIVEDSLIQAERLRHILESGGYDVRHAVNGRVAIEEAHKKRPALIISDVVMPEMDGFEFCQALKGDNSCKGIPFILLTLLTDVNDIIRALESKADLYIPKPYDTQFLLDKIDSLLATGVKADNDVNPETIEIEYEGVRHAVKSTFPRVINLLLCTYETAVQKNRELTEAQARLSNLNLDLEDKVRELAVSEERFRTLVLTVPDIVYRIDLDGKFVFVNNAVRQLGYEPEELIGVHFGRIMVREDFLRSSRENILPLYAGKTTGEHDAPKFFDERRSGSRMTAGLDVKLIPKNRDSNISGLLEKLGDDEVVVEINSSGMYEFDPSEKKQALVGTVGIIRDISERRLAEAELEKAYSKANRQNSELIKTQNELRYLNESLEELVKKRTVELVDANEQLQVELQERKRAEQVMRESEEKLRRVINTAMDAVLMIDPRGCITLWNKTAERMFGYHENEVMGENLHRFIAPAGFPEDYVGEAARFLETGEGPDVNRILDLVARRENGQEFPVEVSVASVQIAGGWHAVGVVRDVTQKKRLQESEIARIAAESANKTKSAFLANMSHELRTPLNAILGFSEVLEDGLYGDLNDKQKTYVHHIHNSGKHLLGLINDILDISKVEAGKEELEISRFPIRSVLDSSVVMVTEKALKHAIALSVECESGDDIQIEADERKIKQILFNLLSNAVKFTPDGGSVRVSARLLIPSFPGLTGESSRSDAEKLDSRLRGNDNHFIEISVEDTGIGIREEDLPKLFGEFTQLHKSVLEKQYAGTGLGLALTKRLVELHGGAVRVASEFGVGSAFSFTIPLLQKMK